MKLKKIMKANKNNISNITLNQTNIDTAIENADESNKETILEMIDPTPCQVVIDTFNPNDQHLLSLQDDFTYKLPNQI